MNKYQMKNTKRLRRQLVPFVQRFHEIEERFFEEVYALEKEMEEATGIEGIEFFQGFDGGYVGVGNADRSMQLIHFGEIEKEELEHEHK